MLFCLFMGVLVPSTGNKRMSGVGRVKRRNISSRGIWSSSSGANSLCRFGFGAHNEEVWLEWCTGRVSYGYS
jgi:hypothetical protein